MTESEAREVLRKGYYGDEWDTEEAFGFLATHFPEALDQDKTTEEMVAEVCFG